MAGDTDRSFENGDAKLHEVSRMTSRQADLTLVQSEVTRLRAENTVLRAKTPVRAEGSREKDSNRNEVERGALKARVWRLQTENLGLRSKVQRLEGQVAGTGGWLAQALGSSSQAADASPSDPEYLDDEASAEGFVLEDGPSRETILADLLNTQEALAEERLAREIAENALESRKAYVDIKEAEIRELRAELDGRNAEVALLTEAQMELEESQAKLEAMMHAGFAIPTQAGVANPSLMGSSAQSSTTMLAEPAQGRQAPATTSKLSARSISLALQAGLHSPALGTRSTDTLPTCSSPETFSRMILAAAAGTPLAGAYSYQGSTTTACQGSITTATPGPGGAPLEAANVASQGQSLSQVYRSLTQENRPMTQRRTSGLVPNSPQRMLSPRPTVPGKRATAPAGVQAPASAMTTNASSSMLPGVPRLLSGVPSAAPPPVCMPAGAGPLCVSPRMAMSPRGARSSIPVPWTSQRPVPRDVSPSQAPRAVSPMPRGAALQQDSSRVYMASSMSPRDCISGPALSGRPQAPMRAVTGGGSLVVTAAPEGAVPATLGYGRGGGSLVVTSGPNVGGGSLVVTAGPNVGGGLARADSLVVAAPGANSARAQGGGGSLVVTAGPNVQAVSPPPTRIPTNPRLPRQATGPSSSFVNPAGPPSHGVSVNRRTSGNLVVVTAPLQPELDYMEA